jgi:hypothetical protein
VLSDKRILKYKCPNQYFCPALKISGSADPRNKKADIKSLTR